nr:helix-turn-helix transcriptional regulator [Achromobacter mucicolens]
MAARLGVDHSIYIELERPRPRPRQVILDRVSEALGVSPDQLDDSLLGGQFH